MKKLAILSLAVAAALTATTFSGNGAYAQSGSRLCGYWSGNNLVKVGIFVEYGKKQKRIDKKICSKINKGTWDSIQKNPDLKSMTWNKVERRECEKVGDLFVPPRADNDICDKMKRNKPYMVKKQKKSFSIERL